MNDSKYKKEGNSEKQLVGFYLFMFTDTISGNILDYMYIAWIIAYVFCNKKPFSDK